MEGLVANLLNRFLGSYIDNFDPKQLNVGIWSGDVKLRNLKLRREALDKFKLPVDVSEGYLGELTLSIPWSNLGKKPVKVLIENVFLLASPRVDQEVVSHLPKVFIANAITVRWKRGREEVTSLETGEIRQC